MRHDRPKLQPPQRTVGESPRNTILQPADALQTPLVETPDRSRVGDPAEPASTETNRRQWILAAIVALLVGAGLGTVSSLGVLWAVNRQFRTDVSFSPNLSVFAPMPDMHAVLPRVLPAVVAIRAARSCATTSGVPAFESVAGSGMILTRNGEVLTNDHVIAGAEQIFVTLTGHSKPLTAVLVGADPDDDLALVRILNAHGLPVVHLGTSSQVRVGESVLAIGNALALSNGTPSVTSGIVSAMGRQVAAEGVCAGTESLANLIQTQAPINSGDSGGPLIDSRGLVIGMNTASARSSPGNPRAQNIGFAIPVDHIRALLPGLQIGGTAAEPEAFIGVTYVPVSPSLQRAHDLIPATGLFVESVYPGSPAAKAGLRPGDVIVAFDGHRVGSASAIVALLEAAHPGQRVTLLVYRGSLEMSRAVILAKRPGSQ